jgi:hypothetical protein
MLGKQLEKTSSVLTKNKDFLNSKINVIATKQGY